MPAKTAFDEPLLALAAVAGAEGYDIVIDDDGVHEVDGFESVTGPARPR
jgi:hypothetical protein